MSQMAQWWILPAEKRTALEAEHGALSDLKSALQNMGRCAIEFQGEGGASILIGKVVSKTDDPLARKLEQRTGAATMILDSTALQKASSAVSNGIVNAESLASLMEAEYGFFDDVLASPVIEAAEAVERALHGNFENEIGLILVYE